MAKEYKWGYIGVDGEWAIAARFDDAWGFHEGLAAVKVEWARGYIDREGNYVIEPQYQYAGPFSEGRALVQLDDMWGYIDREGNLLTELSAIRPAEAVLKPEIGLPSVDPEFTDGLAPVPKGKKYGYIDTEGRFVIKPQFIQAAAFSEGLAPVLIAL